MLLVFFLPQTIWALTQLLGHVDHRVEYLHNATTNPKPNPNFNQWNWQQGRICD